MICFRSVVNIRRPCRPRARSIPSNNVEWGFHMEKRKLTQALSLVLAGCALGIAIGRLFLNDAGRSFPPPRVVGNGRTVEAHSRINQFVPTRTFVTSLDQRESPSQPTTVPLPPLKTLVMESAGVWFEEQDAAALGEAVEEPVRLFETGSFDDWVEWKRRNDLSMCIYREGDLRRDRAEAQRQWERHLTAFRASKKDWRQVATAVTTRNRMRYPTLFRIDLLQDRSWQWYQQREFPEGVRDIRYDSGDHVVIDVAVPVLFADPQIGEAGSDDCGFVLKYAKRPTEQRWLLVATAIGGRDEYVHAHPELVPLP